jgi:hypothetical protein
MAQNRENRVKIGQNPEKRLRNGSDTVRTSLDGTALTGRMYSTTMEDGTPGAPSVAHIIIGLPVHGCHGA